MTPCWPSGSGLAGRPPGNPAFVRPPWGVWLLCRLPDREKQGFSSEAAPIATPLGNRFSDSWRNLLDGGWTRLD